MKVEIYSDLACPWCYIGERRFMRALAAYPKAGEVEVVFRSFQLDPSMPEEPTPIREYLERRFGRPVDGILMQVSENARGEGIEMAWDRVIAVNTFTAHRLLRLAEAEYGGTTQRTLVRKLFEAYFTGGRNIADHEVLTELAVSVGMDGARVRAYLAAGEGAEETREALAAAQRLGVRAVPTFVFDGKYAVQGAQTASTFLQALEEVERQAAGVAADDGASCADGSCAV